MISSLILGVWVGKRGGEILSLNGIYEGLDGGGGGRGRGSGINYSLKI